MSLTKEWLLPLARSLIRSKAEGPVYALGDQVTWFTYRYALRRLGAAGVLQNASAPALPSSQNVKMVSFRTVLAMLGFEEFYDIDMNGRAALTLDLSQPLPAELRGAAGLVVDIGTCEHIFNVPQVFANIVELLRPGGTVVHLAPISYYDHGFVNFNPIWFREFYEHNHFHAGLHGLIVSPFEYSLQGILARVGLGERYLLSRISPLSFMLDDQSRLVRRFADHLGMCGRMLFLFVAKKPMENHLPVSFPCQRIYRSTAPSPDLIGTH